MKNNQYPLIKINIEAIKGDMSSSNQDLFNIRIHSLKHGEIEDFRALLVKIGHQFSTLIRHFGDPITWPEIRIETLALGQLGILLSDI